MFDLSEFIIGLIGIVSTAISGFLSWFFTRKKYHAEVDNNLITNMKESLDFYIKLVEDNTIRLENVLKRNEELERRDERLEQEVANLKSQIEEIQNNSCFENNCGKRVRQEKIKRGLTYGTKTKENS